MPVDEINQSSTGVRDLKICGRVTVDKNLKRTILLEKEGQSRLTQQIQNEKMPFLDDHYENLKNSDGLNTKKKETIGCEILTMNGVESSSKRICLDTEFLELEQLAQATIQRRTFASSSQQVNQRRNRYHDIVPFDSTRVKLEKPLSARNELECSDYINASFITDYIPPDTEVNGQRLNVLNVSNTKESIRAETGSLIYSRQQSKLTSTFEMHNQVETKESPARYIAAQGPDEATIPLFWEMIWQQNVRVIVMLTNLVEGTGFHSVKCSMYWPSVVGSICRYNNFEIQLYDVQEAPDYIVRKFDVSKRLKKRSGEGDGAGENREIVHIQYISWLDRLAPEEPEKLLQLVDLTRVLAHQYMHRCQNTLLSISSIKPAEKTLMSASTLDVADDDCDKVDNYYSSIKSNHGPPRVGPWLIHCSAGVGRTGISYYLSHPQTYG